MTRNEKIDQIIFDKGILYGECNLETIRGSYRKNQYAKIIILNSQLSPRQKFETKVHELMHDEHTTFDVSSSPAEIMRIEEGRIKRWEIKYLMPVDSLIEAFQRGYTTPLDLADFLEITPEKMCIRDSPCRELQAALRHCQGGRLCLTAHLLNPVRSYRTCLTV